MPQRTAATIRTRSTSYCPEPARRQPVTLSSTKPHPCGNPRAQGPASARPERSALVPTGNLAAVSELAITLTKCDSGCRRLELSMDELTYTLRELCRRNRDGSHATQKDRERTLMLASRQLREAGFWQMRTI